MAVNTRVLAGSLVAAVVISVGGGYLLSRGGDSDSSSDRTDVAAEDDVTITSSGLYDEPGLPTNDAVEGEPLPTVALRNDSGDEISTDELIGQPLVLNVWATTCEPCKRELPAFAAVHQEFGDRVRFVGINSGSDTAEEAREFAEQYGVDYESLTDPNGEFLVKLGITGLPYTLFVAPDGTIVSQKGIELSEDTIRSTITAELLS